MKATSEFADYAVELLGAAGRVAARRMFVDIATSDGPVKMPGNPIRLSDLAALPNTAPPALGQHTKEISDRAAKPSSGW